VSFKGRVKNGVVVLPPGTELTEGMEVQVIAEPKPSLDDDPFAAAVGKVARPRPHWPKAYALNHDHYLSGAPKKP